MILFLNIVNSYFFLFLELVGFLLFLMLLLIIEFLYEYF
jgi:hypothetical protein